MENRSGTARGPVSTKQPNTNTSWVNFFHSPSGQTCPGLVTTWKPTDLGGNARRGPANNRRTTPLGEPVLLPICTTLSRPCGQMENRPPWQVRANPKRTPTKNSSCKPELIDDFSHAWPDKRPGSSPNTCDFAFFEANPSTKTMLGRDASENVPN